MSLSNAYQNLRAGLKPGLANTGDTLEQVRAKMHAIHPTDVPADTRINELPDFPVRSVSVLTPNIDEHDSAVMMVHGGAFVSTRIEHYIPYAAALSRFFRRPVVVFNYRLAPEHPYPAALDDSVAVYRALLKHYSPNRLAVIGDSCGGGIALSLLIQLRDQGLPLPAAYAGLTPWLDLTMSGQAALADRGDDPFVTAEWIRQRGRDYAGTLDPKDPNISPLYAEFRGLPPLYFAAGGDDITRDDARRAHTSALSAETTAILDIAEGMIHGYHGLSAMAPECAAGCERIARFLDLHLSGQGEAP